MNKFMTESGVALVTLFVVAVATFLFAPYDWFWPMFGVTVMVVIFYVIYRFHRLWIKRCPSCGSLHVSFEKKKLWPDRTPPFGSKFDCENVRICHNASCLDFLREQRHSCYIKAFSPIEIFWRQIKGEKFPR